ncbi:MAG: hypothetical protein ACRD47_06530 [Nitrososphaeraceae archaeon]
MVVRIDISSLPGHLRNAIMNEIGFRYWSEKVPSNNSSEQSGIDKDESKSSDVADEVPLVEENDTHRIYQKIKDALIKNRIGDYVATKHHKDEDKVVILKRADAERQGIYHCRHCGMEFDDTVKLSVHMRLHYVMT